MVGAEATETPRVDVEWLYNCRVADVTVPTMPAGAKRRYALMVGVLAEAAEVLNTYSVPTLTAGWSERA